MADAKDMAADFEAALRNGDFASMTELAHKYAADDFVQEWPQSGERLTLENSLKLLESYSEKTGMSPKFSYKRVLGAADHFMIEGTIDYGDGIPVSYIGIADLRDGKITRLTEFFANPFEAPAWRANFVEHMEPVAV